MNNNKRTNKRIASLVQMASDLGTSGFNDLLASELQESAREFSIHEDSRHTSALYLFGAFQLVTQAVANLGSWLSIVDEYDGPHAGSDEPDEYRRGYEAAIEHVRREFAPRSKRDEWRDQKQATKERAKLRAERRNAWESLTPEQQRDRWRELFENGGLPAVVRHASRVGFDGDVRSLLPETVGA